MIRTPRQKSPWLRSLVFVLLALGLFLQPVFAAVGEAHEFEHNSSGMHAHGLHPDDVAAELAAAGEQSEDGAETLHVLLHFAHCCGATAAMLPVLKPIPIVPLGDRLAIAKAPIPPQARLTSPFKPPIFV